MIAVRALFARVFRQKIIASVPAVSKPFSSRIHPESVVSRAERTAQKLQRKIDAPVTDTPASRHPHKWYSR